MWLRLANLSRDCREQTSHSHIREKSVFRSEDPTDSETFHILFHSGVAFRVIVVAGSLSEFHIP